MTVTMCMITTSWGSKDLTIPSPLYKCVRAQMIKAIRVAIQNNRSKISMKTAPKDNNKVV